MAIAQTSSTDQPLNQLGFVPRTEQQLIAQSRAGVTRGKADEVAALVGLTDKELAGALNLSPSYLHRLKPEQRLNRETSERLLLLENLFLHALDTFNENAPVVLNWLRTPVRELDNQTPLHTLDTITGYALVDRVLGRLDWGIFG